MKNRFRDILCYSYFSTTAISLALLTLAGSPEAGHAATASASEANDAALSDTSDGGAAEILVTARRREERAQDVPIALRLRTH